jgi:hypothetical protein
VARRALRPCIFVDCRTIAFRDLAALPLLGYRQGNAVPEPSRPDLDSTSGRGTVGSLSQPLFGGTNGLVLYVVGTNGIVVMGSDSVSNDAIAFFEN